MDARRLEKLLPLAIFLFAFLIRLPGLGWGLKNDIRNASLHPDEAPNFGYSRSVVPGLGQFTPGFYNYGTLYLTTLRVASDVATAYTGAPKTKDGWSWSDPRQTDWDWVARCNLAGRWISLLAGALTALIAYAMGRRTAGPVAGGIAGLVIAIAPAHVVHSRFQTPDVLAAALIAGSLYFAVRALDPKDEKARLSPATWCGIFAGLSAGVKYTGILVLLALYAALALRKHSGWIKQAVVATLTAVVVFILTTPGVLLQTDAFLKDFTYEMQHTATGQELFFAGTSSGFVYHLMNLFVGIGPVLVLGGLAGLIWAANRRHSWAIVVLAFWLPYYLLIGKAEVKFMRYTFPLYVGIAAGFGYAVATAQRRKGWDKAAVAASILGVGGIPGGGLRDTIPLTLGMVGEDPRDTAGRFLKSEPTSVGLARDPWYWSASLVPNGADPRGPSWRVIQEEIASSTQPKIEYPTTPEGGQTYFDMALFDGKPDRIAASNFEVDYPENLRNRKDLPAGERARVDQANAWMDRLRQEYEIEKTIGLPGYRIEDMDYVRPRIYIWKRKSTP